MRNSVGLGLGGIISLSSGRATPPPESLFQNGEQGAWYDPSDNSTMYTSSLAEVGVTSVETAVGLILDKSKGLVIGADASNGVWLNTFTTTFDTFTSTSSSGFTGTTTGAKSPRVRLPINFVASTWYWIEFTISLTNATASVTMGTDAYGGVGVQPASVSTSGTYRILNTGTATTSAMFSITATGAATVVVSNFTIKPLPGNHAYQTTSASRPTLRARYNLLTYSEEFNNAAWTKQNTTVTANATTAPDGTLTADKVIPNTTLGAHAIRQDVTTLAQPYVFSIYAKASEYIWLILANTTAAQSRTFNLQTGVVGTSSAGTSTATITSVGNGWYRCTITGTATAASNAFRAYVTTTDDVNSNFSGDDVSGMFIWGSQVVPTAVFPSNVYQRIAAATDYATGAAFPQYLSFDGTDDSLLTANVDFATVTSDGQARRNLLLNPTQFDAAAWTAFTTTVSANATTAPDGTLTAEQLTAAGAFPRMIQNPTLANSTDYVGSVYLKQGTAYVAGLQFINKDNVTVSALFNLSLGTLVSGAGTITDVGNGWYRCSLPFNSGSGATTPELRFVQNGQGQTGGWTGTNTIFAWGAQLETGSTATAFQNIGTDKMTVFTGLSKLSDAATVIAVELGNRSVAQAGSFTIAAPAAAAATNYGSTVEGSAVLQYRPSPFAAPITNVLAIQYNIDASTAAAENIPRVNTVVKQDGISGTSAGTGNFGNYALFIGRRNNASLPFNGRIYSLIVCGANFNNDVILQTESYVASKTPLGSVP